MSKVEIIVLVIAILIPFISILVSIPFFKKNVKAKPETKSLQEFDDAKKIEPEQPKVQENKEFALNDFAFKKNEDDFTEYLNRKVKNMNKPSRIETKDDLGKFGEFKLDPIDLPHFKPDNKTISSEWDGLSPQMKALIISGFLDKKY